jgi:hypothetical protein
MKIPDDFEKIIVKNYKTSRGDIGKFFNDCFNDLIEELHITDYQARASKTGEMFEYAFWYLIKQNGIDLQSNFPIPQACMEKGGSLDFGIIKKGKVICGIEAKGSSEDSSSRPALKRTDTVKKAIAQAYQFKRTFPKTPFFIVTNVMPDGGNARCMLNLAEGDIIDKVVDLTNSEHLKGFIETLKILNKIEPK